MTFCSCPFNWTQARLGMPKTYILTNEVEPALLQGRHAINRSLAAAEVILLCGHNGARICSTIACRRGLLAEERTSPLQSKFLTLFSGPKAYKGTPIQLAGERNGFACAFKPNRVLDTGPPAGPLLVAKILDNRIGKRSLRCGPSEYSGVYLECPSGYSQTFGAEDHSDQAEQDRHCDPSEQRDGETIPSIARGLGMTAQILQRRINSNPE
jgi:hypothetical protein